MLTAVPGERGQPGPAPDDQAWIEAFLHGEERATAQAYDWIRAVVHHRGWRLGQSDDLVQDVAVELVRVFTAGRFEGRSSLKTFVQRIAKYTCLDAVRRERRASFTSWEETAEPEAPSSDSPDERLDAREVARLCYAVLSRLPAPCRSLLRRVLTDDPGYDELAAELGVAVGTVKSRVARCRARANELRRRLLRRPKTWRGGAE